MFNKDEQKRLPYRMLVFAEVVRTGSFTQAAEVLGHTKSGVSTYINQLEQILQCRLLNRSTRRLELTAAGELFAQRCHELESTMGLALDEVRELQQQPAGRLAITAPNAFSDEILAPVIEQMCRSYPALEPELVFSDHKLDLLEHKLDIAISVGALKDSNYRALPLGHMKQVLVASPTWWHRENREFEPCRKILTHWQQDERLDYQGEEVIFGTGPQVKVNTLPGAVALAKQGMGLALIPQVFVRQALAQGDLIQVFEQYSAQTREVYAVHPYQRQLPLVLRVLIEKIKARLVLQ